MKRKQNNQDLFDAVIEKASLKQEIYAKTLETFNIFKEESKKITDEFQKNGNPTKWPIPFEFRDRSVFVFELKFGSDILIYFMHTNVFEFSRDHEVMQTPYIRERKDRSYCGIIHIFNFLGDSFKYNRTNDIGYLIGRIFINRELHYFIEGKREIGLLYNNFATSLLDRDSVRSIVRSSILYTLNFDLLTPPYENLKEVTVQEMQNVIDSFLLRTGKRLGFRFQADKLEDK